MNQEEAEQFQSSKNIWKITTFIIGTLLIILVSTGLLLISKTNKTTTKEESSCLMQETEKNITPDKREDIYIDRSGTIYSPDSTSKIYLEKEYDPKIRRFIRQSVILENLKNGNKKILNELKFTSSAALERYANGDCTSDFDFDEFKPVAWLGNDMIEIDQYFDGYECAGAVTSKTIYKADGKNYFTADLVKKFDYTTSENTEIGWIIDGVCQDDNRIVFILAKDMFGGYSYLEYSKKDAKFTKQLVEKDSTDETFGDFRSNCSDILNPDEVKKFFK